MNCASLFLCSALTLGCAVCVGFDAVSGGCSECAALAGFAVGACSFLFCAELSLFLVAADASYVGKLFLSAAVSCAALSASTLAVAVNWN